MRYVKLLASGAFVAGLVSLASCGGGGHGFRVAADPISITSASLPSILTGEALNYSLPFTGGAGGPYHLEKISGDLPKGISTDDATVALVGRPLEFGTFHFTLKLTDLGSEPPTTSIVAFEWTIGIGPLVILNDPDLPPWVFNQFDSVTLLVAGGIGPYSAEVIDDPLNALDEPLPAGLAISPSSTTIAGAPVVSSEAIVRVTIRVRDHADDPFFPSPLTAQKEFRISVLIPDLVIDSTSVPDGVCGSGYASKIEIRDGIPPFRHRLVLPATTAAAGTNLTAVMLKGEPGTPLGVAKGTANSAYKANSDSGASGVYIGLFPEGVYLRPTTGDIGGIPRRKGNFTLWRYYVQSSVLPNSANQNRTRTFSFQMTDSAPPALALDPAATILIPGNGYAAPNNLIKPPEFNRAYDQTFTCVGGCPMDGNLDAPHEDQLVANPVEQLNGFLFGTPTFSSASGPPFVLASYGLTFDSFGRLFGTPTNRTSGLITMNLTVTDSQLPTPPGAQHAAAGAVRFEIGPDFTVITETAPATSNATTQAIDVNYAYHKQTVEIFEQYVSGPTLRAVNASDFVANQDTATPSVLRQVTAGQLNAFSDVNFLTVTVNPTWWAYDNFNLNPRAARAGQHADGERRYQANSIGSEGWYYYMFSSYLTTFPDYQNGYDNAANLAVELPGAQVVHDPITAGTYNDGGLLYAYSREPSSGTGEYGILIVRKDSRLYVPYSENRSATRDGFGDGWVSRSNTITSALQKPQMTVSPDGRIGAMKIKANVETWAETAATSKILLISLSGERIAAWGDLTYMVIDTGSSGGATTGGKFLYADSLTLTNSNLYFLCGNYGDSLSTYWQATYLEHFIYKYAVFGGATSAALMPGPSGDADWTNTTSSPMSTPFHAWCSPGASNYATPTYGNYMVAETARSYAAVATTALYPASDFQLYNWANFNESSAAPHPFRVSANGRACAIVAGSLPAGTTSGTNLFNRSLYVDYDTAASVRRLNPVGVRRRYKGAARGGLAIGEQSHRHYGWYDGPGTQLEISDDGLKVAVVYNNTPSTQSWTATNVYSGSSTPPTTLTTIQQMAAGWREDLAVYFSPTTGTDPWSGSPIEQQVTANVWTGYNPPTYTYGQYWWRFGCLAFNQAASAVVFWTGMTQDNPRYATTGYSSGSIWQCMEATNMVGTMCRATFSGSTISARGSILANASGGSVDGIQDYTTTSPCSMSNNLTSWGAIMGSVVPNGSFYSPNREFFYVNSRQALISGQYAGNRLVGVNLGTSTYITGRGPLESFAPVWNGITNYAGFLPMSYYLYGMQRTMYGGGLASSSLGCVKTSSTPATLSTDGKVYFAGHQFTNSGGGTNNSARSSTGTSGGPSSSRPTTYDYGYYAMMFGIDSNKGGDPFVRLDPGGNTLRTTAYIHPNQTGSTVAMVVADWNSNSYPQSYYGVHYGDLERLVVATGLATDASGVLLPGAAAFQLDSGRISSSIAFSADGAKLIYGHANAGTSEGSMMIKTAAITTSGITQGPTQGGLQTSGGPARFAILNAGR